MYLSSKATLALTSPTILARTGGLNERAAEEEEEKNRKRIIVPDSGGPRPASNVGKLVRSEQNLTPPLRLLYSAAYNNLSLGLAALVCTAAVVARVAAIAVNFIQE